MLQLNPPFPSSAPKALRACFLLLFLCLPTLMVQKKKKKPPFFLALFDPISKTSHLGQALKQNKAKMLIVFTCVMMTFPPYSKVHFHTNTPPPHTHTRCAKSLQFLCRTLQSRNQQLSIAPQSYREVSNA